MSNPPRRSFDMGAELSIVAIVIGVVIALIVINVFVPDRAESLTSNVLFLAVPALGSLYAALKAQEASRQSRANSEAIGQVQISSDANAAATQGKVDDLSKVVTDGFPTVVSATTAAMVDENARKTADALASTLAATVSQQKADDAAQKARDDLAAMHAKMDLVLAQLAAQTSVPPVVATVQDGMTSAIVDAVDRTTAAAQVIADNTHGPIPVIPVAPDQPPAPPTELADGLPSTIATPPQ